MDQIGNATVYYSDASGITQKGSGDSDRSDEPT
jgi:hypothetical protein